jgi:hypothetical protein
MTGHSGLDSAFPFRRLDGLVEQKRFANVFYLGYRALQVEGFRQHNFEDLSQSAVKYSHPSAMRTFCTLMLWLVLLKIRLAFIALANRLAYTS